MEFNNITLADLERVAAYILTQTPQRKILFFYGDLGAGKTTLIKHICSLSGCEDVSSSPTYSIVNEYRTDSGDSLFHMDLYRLKNLTEAYDFGIEEYISGDSLCLIEWPQLIEPIVDNPLKILITQAEDENSRNIQIV